MIFNFFTFLLIIKSILAYSIEKSIPISVPISYMRVNSSDLACNTIYCPNNTISMTPCGKVCRTRNATFEYTFEGEKFEVYGAYHPSNGKYLIYLNGKFLTTVDQNSQNISNFALQYASEILPYRHHTIKVYTLGQYIEIYKFTYWPSIKAIRINTTDINPRWNTITDEIGGLIEVNNKQETSKRITINATKIWIYGIINNYINEIIFNINNEDFRPKNRLCLDTPNYYCRYLQFNNNLIMKTDSFGPKECSIEINRNPNIASEIRLSCIFYLQENDDKNEDEILDVPISVPVTEINITGRKYCDIMHICPPSVTSENCGYRCYCERYFNSNTIFEYTFKGEMFQILGTYEPKHGKFHVYLDDVFIDEINQLWHYREDLAVQYTSPKLQYGLHNIKMLQIGETFEIYRIAYWPTVNSKRLNSTEMIPMWNIESDQVGGVLEYASQFNSAKETKINCTRFWCYGNKGPNNGSLLMTLDDRVYLINEYSINNTNNTLIFESNVLQYKEYVIKFEFNTPQASLWCIYYDSPFPTPTDSPFPTPTDSPFPTPTDSPFPTPTDSPFPTPTDSPTNSNSYTEASESLSTTSYTVLSETSEPFFIESEIFYSSLSNGQFSVISKPILDSSESIYETSTLESPNLFIKSEESDQFDFSIDSESAFTTSLDFFYSITNSPIFEGLGSVITDTAKKNDSPVVIGVICAVIVLIAAITLLTIFVLLKKKNKERKKEETNNNSLNSKSLELPNDETNIELPDDSDRDLNFWI